MTRRIPAGRGLRRLSAIALVAVLMGGVYVLTAHGNSRTVVGYFTSAVGIYPGDQVPILGVPLGHIGAVEPRRMQHLRFDSAAEARAAYFARLSELATKGYLDATAD